VFPVPGFDDYLRRSSTAEGERSALMAQEEVAAYTEKGHVHYASPSQSSPQ